MTHLWRLRKFPLDRLDDWHPGYTSSRYGQPCRVLVRGDYEHVADAMAAFLSARNDPLILMARSR